MMNVLDCGAAVSHSMIEEEAPRSTDHPNSLTAATGFSSLEIPGHFSVFFLLYLLCPFDLFLDLINVC